MKQKITRLTAMLLLVLSLAAMLAMGVSARDILKPDQDCTLELTFRYKDDKGKDQPIANTEVRIYRVADAGFQENTGNEIFTLTAPFEGCKVDLTAPKEQGKVVSDFMEPKLQADPEAFTAVRSVKNTNILGKVDFKDLKPGLYLVTLNSNAFAMNAYLLGLPQMEADDIYQYNVKATPKVQPVRSLMDIQVIKEWKGDTVANRPKSIKVQLLHNGQIAEEAELSQKNNWKMTFTGKPKNGVWTVQESQVPAGYNAKITGPVVTDGVFVYTITNSVKQTPPPLIQTGQLNWPVPVMIGLGVVLMLSGWMMINGRKKEK